MECRAEASEILQKGDAHVRFGKPLSGAIRQKGMDWGLTDLGRRWPGNPGGFSLKKTDWLVIGMQI